MTDAPKTVRYAHETCLADAGWKAYPGICIMPKLGHGKRHQFVPAEFVEVVSSSPRETA